MLLLIGVLLFKVKIGGSFLNMAILVIIGAASFLALGFLISSLAGTAKSSQLASMAIAMPMMFLAGIFFPIDFVPKALSIIAQILPLYYLGHALREVMINGASLFSVWVDIAVLLGLGFVCFAASVKFFRWE